MIYFIPNIHKIALSHLSQWNRKLHFLEAACAWDEHQLYCKYLVLGTIGLFNTTVSLYGLFFAKLTDAAHRLGSAV